ncbi:MAG TPA: (2Fe-2S)-binding protein [Candidatus Dormibacteraeota bacterium]|nr:(2Fe-2S)-binding protein [Candidatus Dormibacteraeota bacterium]
MRDRAGLRLRVRVNGEEVVREISPGRLLLDFLRDDLRLTAAKRGCDVQVCGACTVLVDGAPVSSCCYLAADADGREVVTCEGLGRPGQRSRLQEAFVALGAFQCGYCTPGMLVAATALLAEHPHPTREQVAEYMKGNLCRCTGYARIVDAILLAAGS